MRWLTLLLIIIALAVGAWFVLRDGGLLEQVTEERVEQALLDNGVPEGLATCMAPRLTDRLTIVQLKKLERLAPEEGEERIPLSPGKALERLERVDDREAVETLGSVAAGCGLDMLKNLL
ncbi:MAG: hypothetical protein AAGL10_12440 [Pseudomonadota bacterium]